MGRGGEGGRVRGEGKDGCDETLITSSFLITHSYRSLQNKTLIAYKHVSYVLWEEVSAHVLLLFFANGLSQYLEAFNIYFLFMVVVVTDGVFSWTL